MKTAVRFVESAVWFLLLFALVCAVLPSSSVAQISGTSDGRTGKGTELSTMTGKNGATPAPNPAIAFRATINYQRGSDLKVMNSDGSNQKTILAAGSQHYTSTPASWSPDGKRLVIHSNVSGLGLYLINVDGTGLCKLVSLTHSTPGGSWSPITFADGKQKILYTDYPAGSTIDELFLVNADCSAPGTPVQLTWNEGGAQQDPDWSYDGTKIVDSVWPVGGGSTHLEMRTITIASDSSAAVSTPQILTDSTFAAAFAPRWARTQDEITFNGKLAGSTNYDVWVMSLLSPGSFANITNRGRVADPGWSPDDSQIVYDACTGSQQCSSAIYVRPSDGSGQPQVIAKPGAGYSGFVYPTWRRNP